MIARRRALTFFSLLVVGGAVQATACGGGSNVSDTPPTDATAGNGGAGKAGAGGNAGALPDGGAGTGGAAGKGGKDGGSGGGACTIKPIDPTTLGMGCCSTGAAHCVDDDSVPGNLADQFTMCTSKTGKAGHCMPDVIISQGSDFVAETCEVPIFLVPGVCLSKCIPLIGNNPNVKLLQKATCKADGDVCVPCINPLDNMPTGACELPDPGCPGKPDGGAGAGGSSGAGGKAGAGGGGTTCPYVGPPILDPKKFSDCSPACGGAHCVPSSLVSPDQATQLGTCKSPDGSDGYCAPDTFIASAGNAVPKTCKSVAGAEGRCLSTCLPAIAGQASLLPKDICDDGEKCAPCFNPFDPDPKKATGACSLACDKAKDPPVVLTCPYTGPDLLDTSPFPACSPACGGAHCVPSSLVPASVAAQLTTCAGGYCAPDSLLKTGGYGLPKTCKSVGGSEGRCLSTCLPSIKDQASLLPQDTCATDEKCAPCFNPFAANPLEPTGACGLGCDKPKDPPIELKCPYTGPPVVDVSTFPQCAPQCGGAHCVPANLVPGDAAKLLTACTSSGGPGFCAPDSLVESGGQGVPQTCTSVAGAEGRCLSVCLPDVASKASFLPIDACKNSERCVPCFDPTSADPTVGTGACTLACDKPTKPPVTLTCPYQGPDVVDPKTFPECSPACGGAHCVPSSLIPASQAGLLAPCAGGYCAPDSIVRTGAQGVPQTCTSVAGAEGRCVSTCLPSIASQAALLPQATCPAGEKCAPCFNPTAADPTVPTGACSIACDKPVSPPTVLKCPYTGPDVVDATLFPPCAPACGGAHCVPSSFVSDPNQASQLAKCTAGDGSQGYCAPDTIIETAGFGLATSCNPFPGTSSEGRCTSKCLPAIAAQASQLSQSTCTAEELCAPCNDPFTGADTGACKLSCDAPVSPPFTFPGCCSFNGSDRGTCVPKSSIPDSQESNLKVDACPTSAADYLCIPEELLPGNTPPACTNILFGQGACLPTCLNLPGTTAIFGKGNCPDNHYKCIPCSFAPAGTPGCP